MVLGCPKDSMEEAGERMMFASLKSVMDNNLIPCMTWKPLTVLSVTARKQGGKKEVISGLFFSSPVKLVRSSTKLKLFCLFLHIICLTLALKVTKNYMHEYIHILWSCI